MRSRCWRDAGLGEDGAGGNGDQKGGVMKPSIKKAVSGRTMRVATTFTGAAACVALTGGPAMADTVHPAPAQPGHQPRQARVNPNAIANVQRGNCLETNQSHWFHMGWSTSTLSEVTCFGFTGTYTLNPDFFISQECGGNNKGYVSGTGVNGHRKVTWGHGTTWRKIGELSVSKVHMSGWSGNDKCTAFPGSALAHPVAAHPGFRLPGRDVAIRLPQR
jgi:hypothetical protein